MPDKSDLTVAELRHFIRSSTRARDREIVVEKVKTGSASFEFLKRMEERRKNQECVRTVDMRGRVPYECKSYMHKNQVFWMDDISYGIYQQGMTENNNVFTNSVFENIIYGEHTNYAQNQKKAAMQASQPGTAEDNDAEAGFNENKFKASGNEVAQSYLGYFQKRKEDRLKHTTEITVHGAGSTFNGKTKDISPHGLQLVFDKPIQFKVGEKLRVSYSGFAVSMETQINDAHYEVLGLDYIEPEFVLRLKYVDKDESASAFLSEFIKKQQQSLKGRKKLDIEDTRLTSESLLAELYYTNTTPTIPFFITSDDGQLSFKTVCVNAVNKNLLECFKNKNDIYDFTNLSDPKRLTQLAEYTQDNGQKDPVLAVLKGADETPIVLFDYEFKDSQAWLSFVADKHKEDSISLFKLVMRNVSKPDQRKIDLKIDKLKERAKDSVEELIKYATNIKKAGVLQEVTKEVIKEVSTYPIDSENLNSALETYNQCTSFKGPNVEVLQFGYVEQRREDRYHVSVDVVININDKEYSGATRDLSVKGLCVELESTELGGMRKGDEIKVDFPVLHKRAKNRVKLIEIPYTITCIQIIGDKPVLHLKREKTPDYADQSEFFRDLIGRNIELIKLDTRDIETAAKSRMVSSIAVENTATIPVILQKDIKTNERILKIALPAKASEFTDFFEVEPDRYDFRAISNIERLSKLANSIKNTKPSSMVIYMYKKQIPGIVKFDIYSATDSDFESADERSEFINNCLENDHLIIKLTMSKTQKPHETDLAASTEKLNDVSPHHAQKLQNDYAHSIAIGDIVDLSSQIKLG